MTSAHALSGLSEVSVWKALPLAHVMPALRLHAMPQGSAAPAAQGSTFSPLSDAAETQAHRHIVQELQSMGFPRDRAARAAIAVSNAGTHIDLSIP